MYVNARRQEQAAAAAAGILAERGSYYLFGGCLAKVTCLDEYGGRWGLLPLSQEDLADALAEEADYVTHAVCGDELVAYTEMQMLAHWVRVYRPYENFAVLRGMVEGPALRPDGTLIEKPGYDASSGYFVTSAVPAIESDESTGDLELDELLRCVG